ncbi:malate synthase A [Rubrivirga sp. S365]|uniref:malate synthase n=1 Tax=Rubrivirga litoralis TaxID=3075598 RepID=A0ABU3BQH4_9BACT|nr:MULTISPECIES: malate synthase A [unclassified Rubrivirga]MDT0631537.1 malate synthase A [Rubrivirga sp. F394]MDT7855480.1 malate synthase A [Rubrivirga sp. S365]
MPYPARFRPAPTAVDGVALHAAADTAAARRVLTPDALALVARLHRTLHADRTALLADRAERQAEWNAGTLPERVEHPAAAGRWCVARLPADMRRRRVEITGPVSDARMVINMLSRGADGERADAAMLDFEDSLKPSWANVVAGVENMIGAARGELTATKTDASGAVVKTYALDPDDMPLLMARVRGLHLDEANVRVDGEPVAAGLLDFALVAIHTARALVARGKTPAYYVPKVEHYREARWWSRLFALVEDELGLDRSTIRATFLIETLPAALQMEAVLYELRDHAAGLNGGRWDKIFSDIKCLREHPDRVLGDRADIGMNRPWMRDYARELIRVCHRHGALAMGGMAAFTPGRDDATREAQTAKVVADKEFEASIGHDGCWVSHPYFIGPAMRPFLDALGGADNQLGVLPEDLPARPDLMPQGGGPYTMDGLRTNVRVGIAYLKGWNEDVGCVAWDDLMEDLATLEISRAQVWQWRRHGVTLASGEAVTDDLVRRVFREEKEAILLALCDAHGDDADALGRELARYARAADDARAVFLEPEMRPFLTTTSDLAAAAPPAGGDGAAVEAVPATADAAA